MTFSLIQDTLFSLCSALSLEPQAFSYFIILLFQCFIMADLINIISKKVGISPTIVRTIVQLLDEGNTVPFIARYRKELTEGATDEQLRDFDEMYRYTRNLEARKADVIRLIEEK